ncbi:protein of unknown function [Nitrospira japonica]|uniref:Uncharacterized protein n=1 Tax=Nitrospira japonica TaxID=1325564 RepID=A0A1W1I500_9BACT|nr:protein of unknown function [Nitrospira japonica]
MHHNVDDVKQTHSGQWRGLREKLAFLRANQIPNTATMIEPWVNANDEEFRSLCLWFTQLFKEMRGQNQ